MFSFKISVALEIGSMIITNPKVVTRHQHKNITNKIAASYPPMPRIHHKYSKGLLNIGPSFTGMESQTSHVMQIISRFESAKAADPRWHTGVSHT